MQCFAACYFCDDIKYCTFMVTFKPGVFFLNLSLSLSLFLSLSLSPRAGHPEVRDSIDRRTVGEAVRFSWSPSRPVTCRLMSPAVSEPESASGAAAALIVCCRRQASPAHRPVWTSTSATGVRTSAPRPAAAATAAAGRGDSAEC